MDHRCVLALLWLGIACAAAQGPSARPTWSNESSVSTPCSVWLQRSEDGPDAVWRLRAARRAFVCLESKGQNPQVALRIVVREDQAQTYSLDLGERYLAQAPAAQRAERLAVARALSGKSKRLDAAFLLGQAASAPSQDQAALWQGVVEVDPLGARGRRAMLALAATASDDATKVVWLRRALAPHRGVLPHFGHAEYGGLSAAAQTLAQLCKRLGDATCQQWAEARRAELER